MSNTIESIKKERQKSQTALDNISRLLEEGREFGLTPDPILLDKLEAAKHILSNTSLKVVLIGGFSEGKTSIVSAWLERLDQSMNISEQESSNEVKVYKIDNELELIDTPGLFGFKEKVNNRGEIEKYKEITKKYVSEAHLILYVMNSANPIKDSHAEDLHWLFRQLNLLPRTVFILSRFDEIADVEDEDNYQNELKIKKENVIERLKDIINLTDEEILNLKIVGISANPYGEGTRYWLDNPEEFKKLSHIHTLQSATQETITSNGGLTPIVLETQKTIIKDILIKQSPSLKNIQSALDGELSSLSDSVQHLDSELNLIYSNITNVRKSLRDFVINYFTDLILQLEGTDMTTFSNYYETEIGNEGIILNSNIKSEFEKQCQTIFSSMRKISLDFSNEISRINDSGDNSFFTQGLNILSRQHFNKDQILMFRDSIVSIGKMVGIDLSSYLKFKPWGAINAAAYANIATSITLLVIETWDSYKRAQEEEKFNRLKENISSFLEEQRKELISFLDDNEFINKLFPAYNELKQKFSIIQEANNNTSERKESFDTWHKEVLAIKEEYIEGEYEITQ